MMWTVSMWILCVLAGAAFGALYFALLRAAVRLHLDRGTDVVSVGFYGARLVMAAVFFVCLAHAGRDPLMTGLAGFLMSRLVLVGRSTVEL